MTSETSAAAPASLPEGRFSGRTEFAELIRLALSAAAAQGWREIILCDPDFEDWPLGERAVTQALNNWAGTGRRFTMLAGNYEAVLRQHARFVVWRRNWSHMVDCRSSSARAGHTLPSALWSPGWVMGRLDLQRCTGTAGFDAAHRIALKERLSDCLGNSSPAFPATVLGL